MIYNDNYDSNYDDNDICIYRWYVFLYVYQLFNNVLNNNLTSEYLLLL